MKKKKLILVTDFEVCNFPEHLKKGSCPNLTKGEWCQFKVSVKENEVPTEKNCSRASIFATKASYISN